MYKGLSSRLVLSWVPEDIQQILKKNNVVSLICEDIYSDEQIEFLAATSWKYQLFQECYSEFRRTLRRSRTRIIKIRLALGPTGSCSTAACAAAPGELPGEYLTTYV